MRFVNEPIPVEVRIGADGTPQPVAFAWQGRRYVVADQGRTWIEDGVRCFLVMTPADEVFDSLAGRWPMDAGSRPGTPSPRMNDSCGSGKRKPGPYLIPIVVVLLVAAGLRIIALRQAPPGPRFDETFDALMARRIMDGERPLYFAENFGEEPLNQYLQAAALTAFGWNDVALRFPSVAFGMIEVAAVYALGKRAWNRRAGLAAAAICAGSFWAIFFSRLGTRLILLTALVSLGILMLWRALFSSPARRRVNGEWRWRPALVAGVLLGLCVYTYTAARALPVLLVGCLIYQAIWHRGDLRRQAPRWLLVLLVAGLIAAPLAYYLVANPQAEPRVGQVSGPLDALRQGDVWPLLNYALAALGMFAARAVYNGCITCQAAPSLIRSLPLCSSPASSSHCADGAPAARRLCCSGLAQGLRPSC